jgi:hypothetical protein
MTKIMLHGLTNKPAAELAVLAKSWLSAPSLEIASEDFVSQGYDRDQRAFVIDRKSYKPNGALKFSFRATQDSPLVNPAFVVKKWGDAEPHLKIDGKNVGWGPDFRYGRVDSLDGDNLVVWMKLESTKLITFEVDSAKSAETCP